MIEPHLVSASDLSIVHSKTLRGHIMQGYYESCMIIIPAIQ